tara:strand:+ start:927 stop:2987 length:2061 start_codon:yes stop_codon:yes gene_type:complete
MAETNLKQVAVGLRELNDTTKSGDKATTTQLTNLNKNMEKFLKSFAGDKLDDEEKRRDDKKGKGDKPKSSPIKGFQKDDFTGGMGIAGFALTLGAAVAGFVTGVATWLGGFASKLLKGTWIDKATAGFRSSIAKGVKSLSRNLKNVSNAFMAGTRGFKSMGKGVNGAFKPMGTMSKIMNNIGKGIRFLLTPFRAVGKSIESSQKAGGLLAKIVATFKNLFAGPTKLLSGFGNMFSKGGTLGKVFNAFKVFGTKIPIVGQVISGLIGLFDGFKGFKEQEGGFGKKMTRGIVDFLGSLAKNIIGGLVDLVLWIPKKIMGFVLKTLGFEEFGKMVSEFSLMDLIGDLFGSIGDIFTNTDNAGEIFKLKFDLIIQNAIQGISDWFSAVGDMLGLDGEGFTFEWLLELPTRIWNTIKTLVTGAFTKILQLLGLEGKFDDAKSAVGDFALMALNKLKELIGSILPDADSLLGKLVPDAVYDYVNVAPPPPVEAVGAENTNESEIPELPVEKNESEIPELPVEVTKTKAASDTNPKKPMNAATAEFLKDLDDPAYQKDQEAKRKKRAQIRADRDRRAEDKLLRDEEKLLKIKSTGKFKGVQLEEDSAFGKRILGQTDSKLAHIEDIKARRGAELDAMSKENAQAAGGTNAVMIAPQTSTVTNNSNSNTAAIIDNNLPTQDNNDRSFHDMEWIN